MSDELDQVRRQAAAARGRMKTALKHFPGGWNPSFSVSHIYGSEGPTIRIMLVRKGSGGGLQFTAFWRHQVKKLPTLEQVNDIRYGVRCYKRGSTENMMRDIAELNRVHAEVEDILPLVYLAFRLSSTDKLIQMAAEEDWAKLRKGPARRDASAQS
jgi:hypothetical protein